jgi:hypothetical protein
MPVRRLLWTTAIALAAIGESAAPANHQRDKPRLCERIHLNAAPSPPADPLARAATALARRLMQLNRRIEHGAIFYRTHDGAIRTGDIAAGMHDAVELTVTAHAGETIAGALHTHAAYPYPSADQSRLSREDIALGDRLLELPETTRHLRLYVVDVRAATLSAYAYRC